MCYGRSSPRPSIAPHLRGPHFCRPREHPCPVCPGILPCLGLAIHWLLTSRGTKRTPISQKGNLSLTPRVLWAPLPRGGKREEASHRSRSLLHRLFPLLGMLFPLSCSEQPQLTFLGSASSWKPSLIPQCQGPPMLAFSALSASPCLWSSGEP